MTEKWEKRVGCNCFKCREVEIKIECKDDYYEDNWEKKEKCKCSKCYEVDYKKESTEKKSKEYDRNDWIRDKLEAFAGSRVVISTKDTTHATGTLQYVKKAYVVLGPTVFPGVSALPIEPVLLESNAFPSPIAPIETFQQYYIRLDDIAGFGQQASLLDPA